MADAYACGQTPVEYMLETMNDKSASNERRDWAAKNAAPYLHPRPAPVSFGLELELPDMSTVVGVNAALDKIVQAIATGKVSDTSGVVELLEMKLKVIRLKAAQNTRNDVTEPASAQEILDAVKGHTIRPVDPRDPPPPPFPDVPPMLPPPPGYTPTPPPRRAATTSKKRSE